MNEVVMKRGTLKQKANAHKKLANSIILGSLENEQLTDVEVVTLKQYAKDCAYKEAVKIHDPSSSYEELRIYVDTLLETQYNEAHEFISIEPERIVIGIDTDKVDDNATDKALLMLVDLENFDVGSYHVFGDTITLQTKP